MSGEQAAAGQGGAGTPLSAAELGGFATLEQKLALEQRALERLQLAYTDAGGQGTMPPGWRVWARLRQSGNSKGAVDYRFYDASGKRVHSQREAVQGMIASKASSIASLRLSSSSPRLPFLGEATPHGPASRQFPPPHSFTSLITMGTRQPSHLGSNPGSGTKSVAGRAMSRIRGVEGSSRNSSRGPSPVRAAGFEGGQSPEGEGEGFVGVPGEGGEGREELLAEASLTLLSMGPSQPRAMLQLPGSFQGQGGASAPSSPAQTQSRGSPRAPVTTASASSVAFQALVNSRAALRAQEGGGGPGARAATGGPPPLGLKVEG
ncbi:hypothetical protein V8C86DRAFT_3148445, partial [Haematococcus lacustris]